MQDMKNILKSVTGFVNNKIKKCVLSRIQDKLNFELFFRNFFYLKMSQIS